MIAELCLVRMTLSLSVHAFRSNLYTLICTQSIGGGRHGTQHAYQHHGPRCLDHDSPSGGTRRTLARAFGAFRGQPAHRPHAACGVLPARRRRQGIVLRNTCYSSGLVKAKAVVYTLSGVNLRIQGPFVDTKSYSRNSNRTTMLILLSNGKCK